MDVRVINVNLRYKADVVDRVDVRFTGIDENLNMSGNFSLTAEEYTGNEATEQLEAIARTKLTESINATS